LLSDAQPDAALPKVLVDLLSRSLTSYRAALSLCAGGFPSQAMILCRALFEDLIASHWAVAPQNRAVAGTRLIDQERLADDDRARKLAVLGISWAGEESEPLSSEERKRLKEEFSGRNRDWFGDLDGAKKIARESVNSRGFIPWWFDRLVFLRDEGHHAVHTTVYSLERSSRGGFLTRGNYQPSYGQRTAVSESDMQLAFAAGAACFGLIADLVVDDLGGNTEQLRDACVVAIDSVALSPSKRRKDFGRNDKCWCGSGRKLKACHEV
jgi:hypothetical protein